MHESRKTVTLLFADVVASTELGERLDPEAVRQVMARYFAEMAEVVTQHGGTVEKFIGDEVMAVFGVPRTHEDDALRAVRAAAAMRERLRELNIELEERWGSRLEIRIGINTGQVVAGDHSAGHGFVTGDAVNLAKRIEQAAEPGEILVGETTARIVGHAVDTTPAGPFSAKGKADAVHAERLERVDPTSEALPRRLDARLVGREEEVAALLAAYARAVETRRSQLLTVYGLPGIGKSRLARELVVRVQGEARVLVGRCVPYGDGITFWPVREILPDESLEGAREEIFWRVRKRLEALDDRPLVVCFDDVHWAEPTFLDLVQYLAGWMQDTPVLILCLARTELFDKRPDWPRDEPDATSLPLRPLDENESGELLELLGTPESVRERIARAAEGNPLFVEQMAAIAADGGADVTVPLSIQAVLAARLDALERDEGGILECAAVVGRDFSLRAVLELVPEQLQRHVSPLLLGLMRQELVRPRAIGDEDGYRFRHALIRDAAYERMPKRLRAELHERHADWLEAHRAAEVGVGYHLEQAVLLRRDLAMHDRWTDQLALRAGERLGAAGRRAFRRDDVPAAINLLERATRLVAGHEEQLAELLTELGTSLGTAGRLTEADEVLDRALTVAQQTGDRRSELRALILREQLRSFTAKTGPEAYAQVAADAIPELEQLGDDLGLAKAWRLASSADAMACRWTARTDALERALTYARRTPDTPQERSSLIAVLAQALYYGPVPVAEAIERCRGFLEEAEGHPAMRAAVLAHLGGLLAMQGSFDEAHALYGESTTLHEELGLRFRGAVLSLVGAEIAVLEENAEAAERQLRDGSDILEKMGASGARAVLVAVLGDLLCEHGRDDEAADLAELTAEIAEADDVLAHTLRGSVVGRVQARRGDLTTGLATARDAVAAAMRTDFPRLQALTSAALGEVEALTGDFAAAQRSLDAARAAYDAKGNTVASERLARESLAT